MRLRSQGQLRNNGPNQGRPATSVVGRFLSPGFQTLLALSRFERGVWLWIGGPTISQRYVPCGCQRDNGRCVRRRAGFVQLALLMCPARSLSLRPSVSGEERRRVEAKLIRTCVHLFIFSAPVALTGKRLRVRFLDRSQRGRLLRRLLQSRYSHKRERSELSVDMPRVLPPARCQPPANSMTKLCSPAASGEP